MKLAMLLFFLAVTQMIASETYSQSTKINLHLKDVKIKEVLSKIEENSEFFFLYNGKLIDVEKTVDLIAEEEPIKTILEEIFANEVKFIISDRQIILTPPQRSSELESLLEQRMITGRVTDNQTGDPLPGVNVVVTGTTLGTTTDIDGNYNIEVPQGVKSLTFSFIGMESQEIPITNQTRIDVKMVGNAIGLEEVVVVGYGTQKKLSLTSAVSSVKGEELTKITTANIHQSLQGKVSGLTIIDQGGSPGKQNMVVRVRGITTLGTNDPLVIVDGIEQRLADINPKDIESITVLKDASSTAIYGSRAANGVILVTTKRAKSGELSVSFDSYFALQKSNNNPVHMGLEDYMRLQNVAYFNSYGTIKYSEEYIQEYVNATDRYKYPLPNTWYQTVFHTAPQYNYSFLMSGGNETIKSFFSVRHQYQEGIISNLSSKLSEARLNNDFKVSSKINISTDINFRHNNILEPYDVGSVFYDMVQASQWTVPRYPDGTYGVSPNRKSPLVNAELAGTTKTFDEYFTGIVKGNWTILKGLAFTMQFGVRYSAQKEKRFKNSFEIRDYYDQELVKLSVPLNELTETRNNELEFTINNLLNYTATLGNHFLNILAGISRIANDKNSLSAFRQGFYNNDIQSISQGANDASKTNSGIDSEWSLDSYFGRLNYSYKEKYLLETNVRYDGSSRFPKGKRYSFFPSASAAWRISNEGFWSGLKNSVNEFKIRASLGETGNQAVDLYSYFSSLSLTPYSFNGVASQGFSQLAMTSENLSWETTRQFNFGLDAQFIGNRISLSMDYYHKKTYDILLTLPIPGLVGLTAGPQNAGRVDNKGWEFLIGTVNDFGKFGFDGNFSLNINDNKVVDLAGTGPFISGGLQSERSFLIAEGYPYNAFAGYNVLGYFQTEEEVENYPTLVAASKPGDIKYEDINKDGKITNEDLVYQGPSFPRYTYSSNLTFKYNNLALNMFVQGVAGAKTRIGGHFTIPGTWEGFCPDYITDNYWTPERPNALFGIPRKYDSRNDPANNMGSGGLLNAAYLRLKNIQLTYQIPASLTRKVGIELINIYVAATNLLTISELTKWHFDPETRPGSRANYYPQTSTKTIGINIKF